MKNLTLTRTDEKLSEPDEPVAAASWTIELSIDDDCAHDVIDPLPNVDDGDILTQVIEYFRKHSEAVAAVAAVDKDMSAALDNLKPGGPDDKDRLYDLTMAANYLNVAQRLLNLARNTVANLIERKLHDDKIRRDFHMKKDFTLEEEEIEGKADGVSRENEDACP